MYLLVYSVASGTFSACLLPEGDMGWNGAGGLSCMTGCNSSIFSCSLLFALERVRQWRIEKSTPPPLLLVAVVGGWRRVLGSDTLPCSWVLLLWSSVTPLSHPGSPRQCHRLQGPAAKNHAVVWRYGAKRFLCSTPAIATGTHTSIDARTWMLTDTPTATHTIKIRLSFFLLAFEMLPPLLLDSHP